MKKYWDINKVLPNTFVDIQQAYDNGKLSKDMEAKVKLQITNEVIRLVETCFKVTNITIEIDSEYCDTCVPEARSPIRNRESVKHLEEEARKL